MGDVTCHSGSMKLVSIDYKRGKLTILDQRLLPDKTQWVDIETLQDAWDAIKDMKVRGAPAIAIVAMLSVAVEMSKKTFLSKRELREFVANSVDFLVTARPTAVNVRNAAEDMKVVASVKERSEETTVEHMKERLIQIAEQMLSDDVATNVAIGEHGAQHISASSRTPDHLTVLTHCNTGTLATAGYGTALGVIRRLHEEGKLAMAFCTETRPFDQGRRLTAFELVTERIPATLICDNMVAAVMKDRRVDAIVVGADRVVANGDTANKIGTYQIAIVAKEHDVPFYVACPSTTVDATIESGMEIPIEQRNPAEISTMPGLLCWNPAFDVTPHHLITGGIITEKGVFDPRTEEWKLFVASVKG